MCRQGESQVLQFHSNMKIIKLKVEVTNLPAPGKLAEDAHETILNVTLPDALRYSGVRSEVRPLEGSRGFRNVHFLVISSCHAFKLPFCLSSICKSSFTSTFYLAHASTVTSIAQFTLTVCSDQYYTMRCGRNFDL